MALKIITAWGLVVFVGLLAGIILWKILTGKMDLTKLVSEQMVMPVCRGFNFWYSHSWLC